MGRINITRIRKASSQYYNSSQPEMTDEEYDAAKDALKEEDPDNPVLAEVGAEEEGLEKVEHAIPMGSLDKCSNIEDFATFYPEQIFCLSWKIDGSSISLQYKNGKLIQALTRGDGNVGGNVTFSVKHIKGITEIAPDFTGYIRGEVYIRKSIFESIVSDQIGNGERPFENPRNAASGILRNENCKYAKYLNIKAFDMYADDVDAISLDAKMLALRALKFETPYLGTMTHAKVMEGYKELMDVRDSLDYCVDGLVAAITDTELQNLLGSKDGRPKWARALKFPAPRAVTKLLGVSFTMGHTGAIVPTAELEPVRIAGTTVKHALLCNADEISRLDLKIGDYVVVSKRGDIIPKIEGKAESFNRTGAEKDISFPSECPWCKSKLKLDGARIQCTGTSCTEKAIQKMISFVSGSKMDMMHIGEQAVRALYSNNLAHNVKELLSIEELALSNLFGINGSKMYRSITEVAQKKAHEYLGSLGIEGCGKKRVKKIIETLGLTSAEQFAVLTASQLLKVEGFQDTLAQKVAQQIAEAKENILAMPKSISFVQETLATDNSVCFTGKVEISDAQGVRYTRERLQEIATKAGWRVDDSVTTSTKYLVQADPASTSSKSQKARKYGTQIISDVDFLKIMGV